MRVKEAKKVCPQLQCVHVQTIGGEYLHLGCDLRSGSAAVANDEPYGAVKLCPVMHTVACAAGPLTLC
jgi:hypothetical protein